MDSDGGDSVHSLPVQPSAPLYFPPLPSFHHHQPTTDPPDAPAATVAAATAITAPSPWFSYADIIRADAANKSGAAALPTASAVATPIGSGDASGVSFLAELPSQPIIVQQIAAASAGCPAVDPVPCRNRATPKSTGKYWMRDASLPTSLCIAFSSFLGVPLRRAASLPPTSPSLETPPVVIVGASSSAQGLDDVTFGFELNEQLLALSIQPSCLSTAHAPSPRSPPHQEPVLATMSSTNSKRPPLLVDLTLDDSGTSSSSHQSPDQEPQLVTPPSSPPESQDPSPLARPTPVPESGRPVDFASRYRERPELLNRPFSKRSYEIVDFISQGINRLLLKDSMVQS